MNSELGASTRQRSSFFGVLPAAVMSLFSLLFSFNCSASDYKVDYAIDARGVAESERSVECTYGRPCTLEFKETHISIFLTVNIFSKRTITFIYISGADTGCCYFSDGDSYKTFDTNNYNLRLEYNRYIGLDIFEGRRRRGNEVVGNFKIGTLFFTPP